MWTFLKSTTTHFIPFLSWQQSLHFPAPLTTVRATCETLTGISLVIHLLFCAWATEPWWRKISQMGDGAHADAFSPASLGSSCFWCIFSAALGDSHCCFLVVHPKSASLLRTLTPHALSRQLPPASLMASASSLFHKWTCIINCLPSLLRGKGASLLYSSLTMPDPMPYSSSNQHRFLSILHLSTGFPCPSHPQTKNKLMFVPTFFFLKGETK